MVAPLPPVRRTIITPPVAAPTPIPAPVLKPVRTDVVFDLAHVSGQYAYYLYRKNNPTAPPLTEEEWEVSDIFAMLPTETQEQILQQYNATGLPVPYKLQESKL